MGGGGVGAGKEGADFRRSSEALTRPRGGGKLAVNTRTSKNRLNLMQEKFKGKGWGRP